jgi:C1A family cysteine protease
MRSYGWRPTKHDPRAYQLSARIPVTPEVLAALPPSVDLRMPDTPIFDQGHLGSCTDNAAASLHYFVQRLDGRSNPIVPSRLMLYYNARVREGSVLWDNGSEPGSVMATMHHEGVCDERLWPYDISRFTERPPDLCYQVGKQHTARRYEQLMDWPFTATRGDPTGIGEMKACLHRGYPFIFGFPVYQQFESDNGGNIEWAGDHGSYLGGHCCMAVGYDDHHRTGDFLCQNSWGPNWGYQGGFFWMPYDYMKYCGMDKWTLTVEGREGMSPTAESLTQLGADANADLHQLEAAVNKLEGK